MTGNRSLAELQRLESERVVGSYARMPVDFVRGEGASCVASA
jgi:hypothetical protein